MMPREERLARNRAAGKRWREANKEKIKADAKISRDNYRATMRARVAVAMTQDVATRRNTEEL